MIVQHVYLPRHGVPGGIFSVVFICILQYVNIVFFAVVGEQAVVESQLLYIGTSVVWYMGRRVYIVHDQHIWSHHISTNWLDGGQLL